MIRRLSGVSAAGEVDLTGLVALHDPLDGLDPLPSGHAQAFLPGSYPPRPCRLGVGRAEALRGHDTADGAGVKVTGHYTCKPYSTVNLHPVDTLGS